MLLAVNENNVGSSPTWGAMNKFYSEIKRNGFIIVAFALVIIALFLDETLNISSRLMYVAFIIAGYSIIRRKYD